MRQLTHYESEKHFQLFHIWWNAEEGLFKAAALAAMQAYEHILSQPYNY